jgi:NAD+ kinase
VGFLPQAELDDWPDAIARIVSGDFWLEERIMVYAEHWREGVCLSGHHSLNEVVVTRGALARPVHLEARIDSSKLTTYTADGLIVSTPTGSTAYALAAGGPILPPDLRNLIMIPIAPHLSIDRAIVLAEGTKIDLTVYTDHEAILSSDGQIEIKLQDGDRVKVSASDLNVSFVRLQDRSYFYRNLAARLVFK